MLFQSHKKAVLTLTALVSHLDIPLRSPKGSIVDNLRRRVCSLEHTFDQFRMAGTDADKTRLSRKAFIVN